MKRARRSRMKTVMAMAIITVPWHLVTLASVHKGQQAG
jgi:hypothetical protein